MNSSADVFADGRRRVVPDSLSDRDVRQDDPMSDATDRADRANRSNYATELNLQRRQALLACALPAQRPQPQLWDFFTWPASAAALDLGCGNGLWTGMAAARTTEGLVVGLDLSMGMLLGGGQGSVGAPRVQGDGHRLPFADASFDVVLALWCLYHMPDKAAVLSEVRRVLRPSGVLIAATNEAMGEMLIDRLMADAVDAVRPEDERGRPWMEAIDFTSENGAEILGTTFGRVESALNETPFEVRDADVLHGYALSLGDPVMAETGLSERDFDEVVRLVDEAVAARLAAGPIRFFRRTAFFVASS